MTTPIRLHTFAKLNLSLRVYPPLENGFHPLRSLFQTISLHDTLVITPKEKKSLSLTYSTWTPGLPHPSKNLLSVVYNQFCDQLPVGFHIELTKQIPIGAGLGGGSGNTAGFLAVLNRYLGLDEQTLHDEARRFGSDIPFFLTGGTALVEGTGERISAHSPIENHHAYVLINPKIHSSTPQAYKAFDARHPLPTSPPSSPLEDLGYNDLEPGVLALHPEMQALKTHCQALGYTHITMTGSGSTFFIPFATPSDADNAKATLSEHFPNYMIAVTHPCTDGFQITTVT